MTTAWAAFVGRGGAWVVAQVALMVASIIAGPLWRAHAQPILLRDVGSVLIAIGGAFGIAGVAVLGASRTIFPKPRAEAILVREGVYQWVRHPLYFCLILISVGWCFWWASWPAGVVAVVMGIFLDAKARREEAWLREWFEDYDSYSKGVKRLIPGIY